MSLHTEITSKIVAQMEAGVRPWMASWDAEGVQAMPRRSNGELYSGINILLLWAASMEQGFKSARWMTFKQAQELGGCVRKGSKGTKVVYASTFVKEVEGENGETAEQNIAFLKQYTVFNCEQIDGLPERFYSKPVALADHERIEAAERFLMKTGVRLQHGGGQAFYVPSQDYIQMPELGRFDSAVSYYATLAHESIHATRHETRLNRDFGRKRFGDEGYAMEELVAELGAAFLCAELGLSTEPREDHASYLASWLRVLKSDPRAIFTAASYASKACEKLREMVAEYVPPVAPQPAPTKPRKARKVAPKASRSNVVAIPVKAPVAAPTRVAAELERIVKVTRKRAQVGGFVVAWADGSETRVSGVAWSKDGDQWAAAYQAANRLRRMRARHEMIPNAGSYMVMGACGIAQLSPAYWERLKSLPMPAPVRIELEGTGLAWGENVKIAA